MAMAIPVGSILLLVLGIALLVGGARTLTMGGVDLARRLRLSRRWVGLVVLAMGTTLPEVMLALNATAKGYPSMALACAVGSTLANLLLVVGLAATVRPFRIREGNMPVAIPVALFAAMSLAFLGADVPLSGGMSNTISRGDGMVLLAAVLLFVVLTLRRTSSVDDEGEAEGNLPGMGRIALAVGGGLLALLGGSLLSVRTAIELMLTYGLAQEQTGLILLAVLVALPELCISLSARGDGNGDLLLGNVVGASIYNMLLVPGLAALLAPMPWYANATTDMGVVIIALILLTLFMVWRGRRQITRAEGVFLMVLYLGFIAVVLFRTPEFSRVLF